MTKKWTVDKMKEYGDFCGFDTLRQLMNNIEINMKGKSDAVLIKNKKEKEEARALVATIFETGARIREITGQKEDRKRIPGLHYGDIVLPSADWIEVTLRTEKSFDKIGEKTKYKATNGSKYRWETEKEAEKSGRPYEEYDGWITEKGYKLRKFKIPANEPLVDTMIDWWRKKGKKEKPTKPDWIDEETWENYADREKKGRGIKVFGNWLYYNKVWNITRVAGEKMNEEFPPHRLRAERATHLMVKYGLPELSVNEWFRWEDEAKRYATLKPVTSEQMLTKSKRLYGAK